MSSLFEVHRLNEKGMAKATQIAEAFDVLITRLQVIYGIDEDMDKKYGRETVTADPRAWAIVKTKLQEANFFAKRIMAEDKENQLK